MNIDITNVNADNGENTNTKKKIIWAFSGHYEKFIHVGNRGKFYVAIMQEGGDIHPRKRFARRKCKRASDAETYGQRLAWRFQRSWLWSIQGDQHANCKE
jgi:hypothetical protein